MESATGEVKVTFKYLGPLVATGFSLTGNVILFFKDGIGGEANNYLGSSGLKQVTGVVGVKNMNEEYVKALLEVRRLSGEFVNGVQAVFRECDDADLRNFWSGAIDAGLDVTKMADAQLKDPPERSSPILLKAESP